MASAEEFAQLIDKAKQHLSDTTGLLTNAKSHGDELAMNLQVMSIHDRAEIIRAAVTKLGEVQQAIGGLVTVADEARAEAQKAQGLTAGASSGALGGSSGAVASGTGWGDPIVRSGGPPDKPGHSVSHARRAHILDGDGSPGLPNGGHRSGIGNPGKTEFPPEWDDDRCVDALLDVARHPDTPPVKQRNGRWRCEGKRDGVTLRAVLTPDGGVHTGHPLDGPGVVRNPDKR
ncbi:MAG: EndoU domain-containing protein [Stackebrandtia sp.]